MLNFNKKDFMFGIGLGEFIVILGLALVFFKPHQILLFFSKIIELFERMKEEANIIKNDVYLSQNHNKEEFKIVEENDVEEEK